MLPPVWCRAAQYLLCQYISLRLQILQHPRHAVDVVKDDHVGHQVAVLDDLALLMPDVLGDDAVAAKKQPLHEIVELFALVGRRVDAFPQLRVIDVFQQKLRSYHPAQLAERVVQLVLAACLLYTSPSPRDRG